MKTIDKYLFQALDNYPFWLEGTVESLDYALSYDAKNTTALCLYGRVHAEQLLDYGAAKAYFQEALGIDVYALEVYPYYIQTLLCNEDYEEAERLIAFALTIKGISKTAILLEKGALLERRGEIKAALKLMKTIKLSCFTLSDADAAAELEKRLKGKRGLLFKKKKKKPEKSNASKKESKTKKK